MAKAQEQEPERKRWRPQGSVIVGKERRKTSLVGIVGRGGVGKTSLLDQLLLHIEWGPDRVHAIFAEDGSGKITAPEFVANYVQSFPEAERVLDQYIDGNRSGEPMPDVLFVDSISGIDDYQMKAYRDTPMVSKMGNRDKIAEYGDKGEAARDFMLKARNEVPFDVIALMTSHEGQFAAEPELAVSGKVIPKNFLHWTDVCLHMMPSPFEFAPEQVRESDEGLLVLSSKGEWVPLAAPHRSFYRTENGGVAGVSRVLRTIDAGEAQTKGDKRLEYVEPAYLPDILKKLHTQAAA